MRGPRSLKQDQALFDTGEGESVEMDIISQQKKLSYRPRKSKKKATFVSERIDKSTWNPFERVKPEILERLREKNQGDSSVRQYLLLTTNGEDEEE